MAKRGMPNMMHVAEHARVSLATVDRVLHGRSGVRPSTVARVMAAANQLGYVLEPTMVDRKSPTRALSIVFLLPEHGPGFLALLKSVIDCTQDRWLALRVQCHIETYPTANSEAYARALLRYGRRYNGLVMIGVDDPQIHEAVRILGEEGIPVITLSSDLINVPRLAYVGMDNHAAGRTAAELMIRLMGPKNMHQRIKFALAAGSLSYRSHVEREAGFMQRVYEHPQSIDVVGLHEGRSDAEGDDRRACALLKDHRDLTGIYCNSGGISAVARALKEFKLAHKVVVIGHALAPETRSLLMDGTLDACIVESHPLLVGNCVRIFANWRDGNPLTQGTEQIRIQVLFRENLP